MYILLHHAIPAFRGNGYLELEDLVFAIAQLLEVPAQLALVRRALLSARDSLVHARRSTDEDFDVLLLRSGDDRLEQVLGDVAAALLPLLRGLVEHVECAESLRELLLQLFQFLLEEDVLFRDIAENQGHLRLVLGVVEDRAAQLVHRGDTGTTSDQRNVVVLVALPRVLADRALEVEPLAGLHVVEVRRHGSVGVLLDDEVEKAALA